MTDHENAAASAPGSATPSVSPYASTPSQPSPSLPPPPWPSPSPSPSSSPSSTPGARPVATYDHALRVAPGWWRGALAIVLLAVAFFGVSLALGAAAIGIDLLTGASTLDDVMAGRTGLTPALMLANNLSLAAVWPLAVLLQWWLFGVRPRWMSSVVGRFRWSWLGRLALVIVPVWAVYVAVSFLFSPTAPIVLEGTVLAMLAVVVLTTPLQSAGEEFGARGLIQRSAASWSARPVPAFVVSTIVSAGIFALAHAASDPWLIAYYAVFGAALSVTARGTGGLEAPVLIHVTNNVLLLVPTALMSQTGQVFDRGVGTAGPYMLLPMAMCLGAALLSIWWGRRNGVETRAPLPPSRGEARAAAQSTALPAGSTSG